MKLFKLHLFHLDYKTMYEELVEDYERALGEMRETRKKYEKLVLVHNEDLKKYNELIEKHAILKASYGERVENACFSLGGEGSLEDRIQWRTQQYELLQEGLGYLKEEVDKKDSRIEELMKEAAELKKPSGVSEEEYNKLASEHTKLMEAYTHANETIDRLQKELECTKE